jgi:hypothetical protein
MSEFEGDFKRTKYIKRLLKRYRISKILKERLILNHLIMLNNVFGPEATARIIFLRIDEKDYNALKTFMLYLNILPENVTGIDGKSVRTDVIPVDMNIAEVLRNI